MKITKLTATRDGKRVNIYTSEFPGDKVGDYSFTVEEQLIIDYSLFVGKELDSQIITELKINDLEYRLYRKSLEKLGRRMHSEFEIKKYLNQRIYKLKTSKRKIDLDSNSSAAIIDSIISRLKSRKYLDDLEFAKWFFEIKSAKKSKAEIRKLLISKGVSQEYIDEVMQSSEKDDSALIRNLIKKKKKALAYKNFLEKDLTKKVTEFLLRKGFQYDEISKFL